MSRFVPPILPIGGTETERSLIERLTRFLNQLCIRLSGRWTNGVDTIDDVIVDSSTKGIVLKSPNGTYWRATISNLGVVTWTNIGTTKP